MVDVVLVSWLKFRLNWKVAPIVHWVARLEAENSYVCDYLHLDIGLLCLVSTCPYFMNLRDGGSQYYASNVLLAVSFLVP